MYWKFKKKTKGRKDLLQMMRKDYGFNIRGVKKNYWDVFLTQTLADLFMMCYDLFNFPLENFL